MRTPRLPWPPRFRLPKPSLHMPSLRLPSVKLPRPRLPKPRLPKPPLPEFKGRLHDPRTATVIGRWLGVLIALCFLTGFLSHYVQRPPDWLAGVLPSRPVWGYRLTQGIHVASGIAAIPLLFAKLWTVYPRLFVWPPVSSVRHALERLSIAVLVAATVFQLLTGLLNIIQWYPWPFSFVPVHFAVAWVVFGSLVLHIAVKYPEIKAHWSRQSPGTLELLAADGPDRRSLLMGVSAAVGAVTVTTVGQTVTPLKSLILFAPRDPDYGEQGLPVNRSAAQAGMVGRDLSGYRLTVLGRDSYELTLDELAAMAQHTVRLPIACVEGWSKYATWSGVRMRDLVARAGGRPDSLVRVVSMERRGAYRVMEMGGGYTEDPLTLLALRLNGQVLSLDHGFPARVIAPNRPGVWQTKWVARMEII
ncbi:molybdopterin-dependent oxidoreductase [Streptomyces sp. MUM 178J]|uniref:molybdopterin-dependent oxidoreductase n=1 Tax=Streptomyces sp. MUM 178J TaxID=2791991 RepID=UPI001F03AA07|nr:molybdopterin-dependent oxidoreductase [Streptomyces sp. MUM 178J]WRQ80081.1 molybdopterin-dependent oxidoreductase [Streptomyces sp. MUM 178J]